MRVRLRDTVYINMVLAHCNYISILVTVIGAPTIKKYMYIYNLNLSIFRDQLPYIKEPPGNIDQICKYENQPYICIVTVTDRFQSFGLAYKGNKKTPCKLSQCNKCCQ